MAARPFFHTGVSLLSLPFSDSINVAGSNSVQFVVYRQSIAVHDSRHYFLWNDTVIFDAVHHIIETSSRREKELSP